MSRRRRPRHSAGGLADEIKYIAPLTVAGIILLSGGPIAATVAALVGAGLGGAALKELFDDYTAPRRTPRTSRRRCMPGRRCYGCAARMRNAS